MSRSAAIGLGLLVAGCASAAAHATEEWPEVARNCELPGATIEAVAGENRTLRLFIPARIRRTEGRVACVRHWAVERRLALVEPDFAQDFALARIGCGMPRVVDRVGRYDPREIRVHFPQRYNAIGQAQRNGSLDCLQNWVSDRGYRIRVVNEYELDY